MGRTLFVRRYRDRTSNMRLNQIFTRGKSLTFHQRYEYANDHRCDVVAKYSNGDAANSPASGLPKNFLLHLVHRGVFLACIERLSFSAIKTSERLRRSAFQTYNIRWNASNSMRNCWDIHGISFARGSHFKGMFEHATFFTH